MHLSGLAVRDEIRSWDFSIQSRKDRSVRTRKLYQVAVRRLLWVLTQAGR